MIDLDKYIRKAAKLDERAKETLKLDVDGETFEFHRLEDDKFNKIQSALVETKGDISQSGDIVKDLIYYSLKDLHDSELLQAFDIVDPPDIVAEIFSPAEMTMIAVELISFNDFTRADIVKKA